MGDRLKDKVAFISGAGAIGPGWGNGKAVAVLFAREGAKVFALDIDRDAAEEVRQIIAEEGGACTVVQADVTKAGEVEAAVAACIAAHGRIDVLHNNVGIVVGGGPVEADEESWDRGQAVNLKSMFLTCKSVLPHMERQGGGAIINISSIAADRWLGVSYASYAATKAGMLGLSQNMAIQYAAKNIRSNCILPGIMDTPLLRNLLAEIYPEEEIPERIAYRDSQVPMGKMGDAWDVAYTALFLASDESRYITGTQIVVDGGLSVSAIAG
ncbi:MAG: SDR family NAD(P)-dependent oxidoreductase [Alphaproteobacteria bacterium]|jgi:NAD(P)-dependent dehydrogenase (short-subunit alcohol dehydrogenase family)|nr:SDR family NAD(P)-dependent oxidoreductase [Alphaproteobacteria bacterium]MDP6516178.1 SDR family NAD(P)-dependent oxidoreductase [Alphaproteobacteria bacterium]|tara:strand:+ start:790 stop:1596 length:807 start_codon:yes stop_codon:yes gene_type:complete